MFKGHSSIRHGWMVVCQCLHGFDGLRLKIIGLHVLVCLNGSSVCSGVCLHGRCLEVWQSWQCLNGLYRRCMFAVSMFNHRFKLHGLRAIQWSYRHICAHICIRIYVGQFRRKNPIVRGPFPERDLQLTGCYASSPPCTCNPMIFQTHMPTYSYDAWHAHFVRGFWWRHS